MLRTSSRHSTLSVEEPGFRRHTPHAPRAVRASSPSSYGSPPFARPGFTPRPLCRLDSPMRRIQTSDETSEVRPCRRVKIFHNGPVNDRSPQVPAPVPSSIPVRPVPLYCRRSCYSHGQTSGSFRGVVSVRQPITLPPSKHMAEGMEWRECKEGVICVLGICCFPEPRSHFPKVPTPGLPFLLVTGYGVSLKRGRWPSKGTRVLCKRP